MTPTKQSDALTLPNATEVRGDELTRIEGGHNVIDGCIPRPGTKGPYVPPVIRDLLQTVTPR